MKWAKVRRVDHKLVELNSSFMNFDTTDFIEVETNQEFNNTDDFVFNPATGSFYNVGVKQQIASPSKQPVVQSPFASADNFRFRGQGFQGVISAADVIGVGKQSSIEWKLDEERFINGTHIMLKGHTFSDFYDIEIVDKDFIFAGSLYPEKYDNDGVMLDWSVVSPDGVVLDGFIKDWYVVEDMQGQKPIKLEYPARLLEGMYIRLKYTAHGSENIQVKLNGFLHMKSQSE